MWALAGQLSDPIKLPITSVTNRQFILQIKGGKRTLLSPTKEILDQLPQPRELLLLLGLNLAQIERHTCTPAGGRPAQFAHNWHCLTGDLWVLESVQGYRLLLNHRPQCSMVACMQLREDQSQALKAEVKSLVKKGAVVPVGGSQVYLTSPFFVVPKSRDRWRPIIDLRRLNQYLRPPHFKIEGLHMLPYVVHQNFFMAKVDLKNTYLTVPASADFCCLLGFQDDEGQLLQFQTHSFGFCTAPYAFSKITKPAVQFLHQAGIHIIIYLDNMFFSIANGELTSARSVNSPMAFLLPRVLITIPKTTIVPSSEIKFLGFTLNTKTMTVALPTIKRSGIQSEVARVLQNKTVCMKVLSQLLDKLVAMKPAVFRAPLHYQTLQHLKISMMRAGKRWLQFHWKQRKT